MHGGKSLKGIASPAFKNGRYSKYLPERLLERYKEAAADPDLLALRHDIALTDTRLADLLKRVDTGEAGQIWQEARKTLQDFKAAQRSSKVEEMREQLFLLEDLIERGASDYQAWHEIGQIMEQKRKLVESERKRLVEMQQMITAEQAMVLLSAVVSVIREHVTDRQTLSAISTAIGQLVAANAVQEINS